MTHLSQTAVHMWPFPYIHITDVYDPPSYAAIAAAIEVLVETNQIKHKIAGYDALGCGFGPASLPPLAFFCSEVVRDWLNSMFQVPNTPYLSMGAHFHFRGSAHGFIHNDYNPGWFPRATYGMQFPRPDICRYTSGEGSLPAHQRVQTIRGVGMIFYVGNEPWAPGDGGETGLYLHEDDPVEAPAVAIPPLNNTMLIYECTPASWHSFLTNRTTTRTNIIGWTHRPYEDGIQRYGAEGIEAWKAKYLAL